MQVRWVSPLYWCGTQNENSVLLPLEIGYIHTSIALLINDSIDDISVYILRHKYTDIISDTQQILKKFSALFLPIFVFLLAYSAHCPFAA